MRPARLPATFAALAVLIPFLLDRNRSWASVSGIGVVAFLGFAIFLWSRTFSENPSERSS